MRLEFNGSSWGLGLICAGVIYGDLSPWVLLLTPLLLVEIPRFFEPRFVFRFKGGTDT
jgi:hypothetical protein